MNAYEGFFARVSDGSERSARTIVPIVMRLLEPHSVVDVGCGVGAWLRVFAEFGVTDYTGVDAAWVPRDQLRIPPEHFAVSDLTQPLHLQGRYDLAISLEVGEHLPEDAAPVLVASLVRLAPAVLFSAAPPGQGGTDHINEQWPEYWGDLFAAHDYLPVDAIRDLIWNDDEVEWWYRQNTLLYAAPAARERLGQCTADPLRRTVHPAWLEARRHQTDPRLRDVVQALPGALGRFAAFHVNRIRR